MSEIVELKPGISEAIKNQPGLTPEKLLAAAGDFSFISLAVIGRETNGNLFISSTVRADEVLALMARATHFLVGGEDLGVTGDDTPPIIFPAEPA